MTTNSPEELLVEGVREPYYTEQQLVDALETLADGTENEEASRAFSEHREESRATSTGSNGCSSRSARSPRPRRTRSWPC